MPALALAAVALAALALEACKPVGGIDASLVPAVSNDDAYATVVGVWEGARGSIVSIRDPQLTASFNLPVNVQTACAGGGQRAYQGTAVGTNNGGTGSATITLTANLAQCALQTKTGVTTTTTTVVASGVSITGSVAITSDTWGTVNIRMLGANLTVNGVACAGGIDMQVAAPTPTSSALASGTICGRMGVVPLP